MPERGETMVKVICEKCRSEIDVKNIDLEKAIAKCVTCNSVLDCSSQLESSKNFRRDDIELPGSINLQKDDRYLKIQFRWVNVQLLYLVPFCLCWDILPLVWYQYGLIPTDHPLAIAYLVFHFIIGVGLTYYCLAGLINKTMIEVTENTLYVKDMPLTFFRNMDIELASLDQFYSREKRHRGKKLSWPSYEVHAILKTGRIIHLVSGLNKSEQALYIEQVLEDYLGITDRPVDGEISRI